jgi:hypothetical protein
MQGITKEKREATYIISLDAMKEMIADKLETHPDNVRVTYVIEEVDEDPLDRYPGHREVTKIKVIVDE